MTVPFEDLRMALLKADRDADEHFLCRDIGETVLPCGLTRHHIAIELREDDEPVSDEPFRITLPDGEVRLGRLSALGRCRIDDIAAPGDCLVVFPELDRRLGGTGAGLAGDGADGEIAYVPGALHTVPTGQGRRFVLPDWELLTIEALSPEQAQATAATSTALPDDEEEERDEDADDDWDLLTIEAALP